MSNETSDSIQTSKLGRLTANSNVVTGINVSNVQFPFHEWHVKSRTAVVDVANYTVNEVACITTEVYGSETISTFDVKVNIPTSASLEKTFVEYYVNFSPMDGAKINAQFYIGDDIVDILACSIDKPVAFHFYETNGNFKVYKDTNQFEQVL